MENQPKSWFRKLIEKFFTAEVLTYIFFGVLTTVVNTLAFELFYNDLGLTSAIAKCIAFAFAVLFAFVTNKLFVFRSKSWAKNVVSKEFSAFFLTRLGAFLLELGALSFCDYVLHVGSQSLFGIDGVRIAQFALSLISVILNYIFSKFLIFKKK